MIVNITPLSLVSDHQNNNIITNECVLVVETSDKHITFESKGRYGFRNNEILQLLEQANLPFCEYHVITQIDKIARLVSDIDLELVNRLTVGICTGRPAKSCFKYLNSMGMQPTSPSEHDRDLRLESNDYFALDNKYHKIEYLYVKNTDIIDMVNNNIIDAVVCYGDIWYNLEQANYNIKYLGNFIDELGFGETHVSLIGSEEIKLHIEQDRTFAGDKKLKVFSEYNDGFRLVERHLDKLRLTKDQLEFTHVHGSVEGYLSKGLCDLAITVVQTGDSLKANNLQNILNLRRIYLNIWMNLPSRKTTTNNLDLRRSFYVALKPRDKHKFLIIEGIDGTGKTTLLSRLSKNPEIQNWLCYDRHSKLSKSTLTNQPLPMDTIFDDQFTRENTKVVIVESPLETCDSRLKRRDGDKMTEYEQINAQCYFRLRYRQLAALNGYHVVNNINMDDFTKDVMSVLNNDTTFQLPVFKEFTREEFNNLEDVAEGESKMVKNYNERFDIIRYKPSVYSHKQQRGGDVEGSDIERQKTTLNIELLLAKHNISHTYWCIYNGFILADKIITPPIEVCVKGAHVGTHKHIYQGMATKLDRFGRKLMDENQMYPEPLVRFDWRNPNHIPETEELPIIKMPHAQIYVNPLKKNGKTDQEINEILHSMFPYGIPMGDQAMCEGLADRHINVKESSKLVSKAFRVLSEHFKNINIRFKDVCFMPTIEGDKLYGEVSQDCGRYEAINSSCESFQSCVDVPLPWTDESQSLDKDIWRAGGTSGKVLEKWKRLTFLIDSYTKSHLKNWINGMFANEL